MTAIRKFERDFAQADLASVRALLTQIPESDFLARMSLEEKVRELGEHIRTLSAADPALTASAALFFGGKPVLGSRGVESDFGGKAVLKFQDLVSKVWANDIGRLGQRGVIANKPDSLLHITDVLRGSFGFLLEETSDQGEIVETPLKEAVDNAQVLLRTLTADDENEFQRFVEDLDPRVLGAARDFFGHLSWGEATLRIVVGDSDVAFNSDAIQRAVDRASTTEVNDEERELIGSLAGALPTAHQFEFQPLGDGELIKGRIINTRTPADIQILLREWVGRPSRARLSVRTVTRNNEIQRESFTLLGLFSRD